MRVVVLTLHTHVISSKLFSGGDGRSFGVSSRHLQAQGPESMCTTTLAALHKAHDAFRHAEFYRMLLEKKPRACFVAVQWNLHFVFLIIRHLRIEK